MELCVSDTVEGRCRGVEGVVGGAVKLWPALTGRWQL